MIISPDTKRSHRIPPGQSQTHKWPVLDASGTPPIDLDKWRLDIFGLVETEVSLDWAAFNALPKVEVFSDFHCVTRWSRLDNTWSGVSTRTLLEMARPKAEARYVLLHAYDYGWTTNLPLADFLSEDALIATHHDGQPLEPDHGAPARAVVPLLYAWKSAKWIGGIELLSEDRAGFWERNGYHMYGDPWKEQRFGWGG
jgi:DMSO/TMAO reductase YedYZ molybdopterin-dependent catalytic subunit